MPPASRRVFGLTCAGAWPRPPQNNASPPLPALRLLLLANLIGEASLLLCYSLPAAALARGVRPRRRKLVPTASRAELLPGQQTPGTASSLATEERGGGLEEPELGDVEVGGWVGGCMQQVVGGGWDESRLGDIELGGWGHCS